MNKDDLIKMNNQLAAAGDDIDYEDIDCPLCKAETEIVHVGTRFVAPFQAEVVARCDQCDGVFTMLCNMKKFTATPGEGGPEKIFNLKG